MPRVARAEAIRLAANTSFEQVKQWANNAYPRTVPSGTSSRAASRWPCDPANSIRTDLIAITLVFRTEDVVEAGLLVGRQRLFWHSKAGALAPTQKNHQ